VTAKIKNINAKIAELENAVEEKEAKCE